MESRRSDYIRKINEGNWNRYLHEMDEECNEQVELSMEWIKEGVTEKLKNCGPVEMG